MKHTLLAALAALGMFAGSAPSYAIDVPVGAEMQSCRTDADCALVDGQCGSACGFLPINTSFSDAFAQRKGQVCAGPQEDMAHCSTVPPLNASCVNQRCTIGVAYQEGGDQADYGSQQVPQRSPAPAPAADEPAPQSSIAPTAMGFDDRYGYNAYDLPQEQVKTRSLGTIQR